MVCSQNKTGTVIWITGLSGAGKTTLARALLEHLQGAILLDGDELRIALGSLRTGYDAQSRKSLAFAYSGIARLLALQGFTVVVATISLFHELHKWNRENIVNYLEVFLDVSEDERKRRDPKGLYRGYDKGQIKNMSGHDLTVEFPENPHLRLDSSKTIAQCAKIIMEKLNKNIEF